MPLVKETLQQKLVKGVKSEESDFQKNLEASLKEAYKKINDEVLKAMKGKEEGTEVDIQTITSEYISKAISKEVSDVLEKWSKTIANEVDVFIKSGTVTTTVNTVVATTGTAAAQTGKGTGSGTGQVT